MIRQTHEAGFEVLPDIPKHQFINGSSITDLGKNGVIVEYGPEAPPLKEGPHYENLIYKLDELGIGDALGGTLVEAISGDINSRQEWQTRLKDAIDLLGINPDRKKNFRYDKAPEVYSTAFMQAYLSLVSSITSELLPANGPCKSEIKGEETDELIDRAQRIEEFINTYLTDYRKDFYPNMEQGISWGVLYGSFFTKTYYNPIIKGPDPQTIKPQDVIVNYNATSLSTCSRVTQILHLTKKELKQSQYNGLYRNIEIMPSEGDDQANDVDEKVLSQEGLSPGEDIYNEMYTLYECHVDLDLKGFEHKDKKGEKTGIPLPYIVTIDTGTQKILSIYRNWNLEDKDYKRVEYFTHYPFFPGLGFYPFGLAHIAGGSANAANIILQQLVDSGVFANFPGGFRAKGVDLPDNTIRLGPGEFRPIDATGVGSIQNAVMPLPFKEPSLVLKDLKNEIEDGIGKMVSAVEQQFADFNPNAPVGTTYALLEQANKLQSSIMRRLHRSMGDMLRILYRLFSEYLGYEDYPYSVKGNKVIGKDFKEDLNIVPVADPNVISSGQRLVRAEALRTIADGQPDLFNMREVYKGILREMKIPNLDVIMPPEEDNTPKSLDPISENANIMQGVPVQAYIYQDHQAHEMVHSMLLQDPSMQQDPTKLSALQAHISQHQSFNYMIMMQQMMGIELPQDPSKLSPEQQNQLAVSASQVAQQLMQKLQEDQPQMDPALIQAQALMKEADVKDKEADLRAQIESERLENERMRIQLEQIKEEQREKIEEMKLELEELRLEKEFDSNAIKLEVEEKKIEQQAKNEELKAETAAYEAQLRYETEQDKIKSQEHQNNSKLELDNIENIE